MNIFIAIKHSDVINSKKAMNGDFEIDLESGRGPKAMSNSPIPEHLSPIKQDVKPNNTAEQPTPNGMMSKFDFRRSSHPIACIFQVVFKFFAILVYLLFGLFMDDVAIFIFVTILLSCDFWTVKNVTGRLLVGLRWWTSVDTEGNEKWIFESFDHKVENSPVDSSIFWWSQIASTGVWTFLLFWKILSFLQLGFFWVLSS